jgi:hypothetical protein
MLKIGLLVTVSKKFGMQNAKTIGLGTKIRGPSASCASAWDSYVKSSEPLRLCDHPRRGRRLNRRRNSGQRLYTTSEAPEHAKPLEICRLTT